MMLSYDNFITPCYVFDIAEFDRSVNGFRNALNMYFDDVKVGYSFKTNTLPFAIKRSRKLGCMAEVVSYDEYELAKICGFKENEIIYNGPMKSKETFLEALAGGAIINIETKREIEWLKEYEGESIAKIGLRLNIDLNEVVPEEVGCSDGLSRFGFSEKTGEFDVALKQIDLIPKVKLVGLHIHRSTATRSINHYRKAVEYACRVIKKYKLNLDYLDVGGGFFGILRNKPTYAEYAKCIYEVLRGYELQNLCIIIEPGCAILSSAFKFLSRVIDIKKVGEGTYFITTDGSRNDVDPLFRKTGYMKEVYRQNTDSESLPVQIVSGCSCMENDRLFTLENEPSLACGDIIEYKNVGAYTMTLSPMFIRLMPRVYAIEKRDGYVQEVRRAGKGSDLLFL